MSALRSIFLFVFFLSELLFTLRMFSHFKHSHILHSSSLHKMGAILLATILVLILLLPLHTALGALCVLHTPLFVVIPLLSRLREHRFKRAVLGFIDDLILGMKTGASFRQAFDEAKARCDAFTQQKLTEVMNLVAFSQQPTAITSTFARFLVEELIQVDQKPHHALARLQSLRLRLKTETEFRRRSGEATKQVRAQALLLLLLYLSLLVVMAFQVRLSRHLFLIALSASLLFAGYILMWAIFRSFRWKV